MEINADAVLGALVAMLAGLFVTFIWNQLLQIRDKKNEKAEKYDQQALEETIEKVVKETFASCHTEMQESLMNFKKESDATFEYWKTMYWEAVDHLKEVEHDFQHLRAQDLMFYKYQLINSCKKYLAQGYITQYQFDRLSELHKIYHDLGGNNQGDLYFERASRLELAKDNAYKPVDSLDDELFVTSADLKDTHHDD